MSSITDYSELLVDTANYTYFYVSLYNNNPVNFYIDGKILYCEQPLDSISPQDYWVNLKKALKEEWDFLYLSAKVKICKKKVIEYEKLDLDIPPFELEKIDQNISLEFLKLIVLSGISPIHKAVCLGSILMIENFIIMGFSINAFSHSKQNQFLSMRTCLTLSLFLGHFDVFLWLYEHKADVYSCMYCLEEFWKYAFENKSFFIPLFRKYKILPLLLNLETKNGWGSLSIYQKAIMSDNVAELSFFLECGADVNFIKGDKNSPLFLALHNKSIKCLKLLLSKNLQINFKGISILEIAVKGNCDEIVTLLLENGVKHQDTNESELLFIALKNKSLNQFKQLIEQGHKLTLYRSIYGFFEEYFSRQALKWMAVQKGELSVFQLETLSVLVQKRAISLNLKNKQGTPLLHALINNELYKAAEILIHASNVNLEAEDSFGMTPLLVAVCKENVNLVDLLIQKKVNVNHATPTGISSLHIAARLGNQQLVKSLANAKANLTALDYTNCTPYHIALQHELPDSNFSGLLRPKEAQFSDQFVYSSYKSTYLPFFKPLLKKNKTAEFNLKWKEEWIKKLAAHLFELKGCSPEVLFTKKQETMDPDSISLVGLEGAYHMWMQQKVYKLLLQFSRESHTDLTNSLSQIISALEFSMKDYTLKDEQILKRIQQNHLTFIEIGCFGHSAKILFLENILILCNRGRGSKTAIKIFLYDPTKLTAKEINQLRMTRLKSLQNYYLVKKSIKKTLMVRKNDFLRKLEKICNQYIKMQTVGNCTFASLDGIQGSFWIYHHALQHLLKNQGDWEKEAHNAAIEYQKITSFLKMSVFEKYIAFHCSNKSLYYPDMSLIENMMKNLLEIKKFDEDFLQKKFNDLKKQYEIIKKLFPEIKFTKPLPSQFDANQEELKSTKGLEPTYLTVFKNYVNIHSFHW